MELARRAAQLRVRGLTGGRPPGRGAHPPVLERADEGHTTDNIGLMTTGNIRT